VNDPLQILLEQAAGRASQIPDNSRYRHVGITTAMAADGTLVVCFQRRFVPHPQRLATQTELQVTAGDRLDNLAARYHDDPELFWQIADANRAMRAAELLEPSVDGRPRLLRITLPEGLPGQPPGWPR
jgi:hypothetical protein